MLKFGLACEGVTDQAVIENILCGFYKDKALKKEIKAFQPLFDSTQQKQLEGEFGGWEELLRHLSTKRFRLSVINTQYMIIQIDTDISEHINFGVSQHNLSTEEFIIKIIERLVVEIDSKKEFYEKHKDKIIFAISVHSLECWILPLFKDIKKEEILNCAKTLNYTMTRLPNKSRLDTRKNYKNYDKLSQKFLKYKELIKIKSKNTSFEIFINVLPKEIT